MHSPPLGHNNPPWIFETVHDLPDNIQKMHYFKLDVVAMRKAIWELPMIERGFFLCAIMVMYEFMEPLPADDKIASMRLGCDVRQYRHLKSVMVRHGLLIQKQSGRLSNARFEEEIEAYVVSFKNRQEAALAREEKARIKKQSDTISSCGTSANSTAKNGKIAERSPRDRRDVDAISPRSRVDATMDFSENINKNNGHPTTTGPQPDHKGGQILEIDIEKRSKEEVTDRPNPDLPLSEAKTSDAGGRVSRKDIGYSAQFENFWRGYPERSGMSKQRAWTNWGKLNSAQRQQAIDALPAFCAQWEARKRSQRGASCLHAEGYLSQRRFESLLELAVTKPKPSTTYLDEEQERIRAMYAEANRDP